MPKPWNMLELIDRVAITIQLFPKLSDEQIKTVTDEWAKNEYGEGFHEEDRAIADLLKALRYESMSEEQRDEEKQRIARSLEVLKSWESK